MHLLSRAQLLERDGVMDKLYLVKVNADVNNNKFYEMADIGDGMWRARWGRVGTSGQTKTYDVWEWDRKVNEKLRKGYQDVTALHHVGDGQSRVPEENPEVDALVSGWARASCQVVSDRYLVDIGTVTDVQVSAAQHELDAFRKDAAAGASSRSLNRRLESLWTVLPRKMRRVSDEVLDDARAWRDKAAAEQGLLDAMAAQVVTAGASSSGERLTEAFGVEIEPRVDLPAKLLGGDPRVRDHNGRVRGEAVTAFKIRHASSADAFERHVAAAGDKTVLLQFHGSRTENWLSIVRTGLVLWPDAQTTGAMFGSGLYFAPDPMKSLRYTDVDVGGFSWSGGSASVGHLGVFRVHVGNRLVLASSGDDSKLAGVSRYGLTRSTLPAGYDSVYAKKGYDGLLNEEVIVYSGAQTTLSAVLVVERA